MPKEKLYGKGINTRVMGIRIPNYFTKEQEKKLRRRFQEDVALLSKAIIDSKRIELLKSQNLREEDVQKIKDLEKKLLESLQSKDTEEVLQEKSTKEVIQKENIPEVLQEKETSEVLQELEKKEAKYSVKDYLKELEEEEAKEEEAKNRELRPKLKEYDNMTEIYKDKSLTSEEKAKLIRLFFDTKEEN